VPVTLLSPESKGFTWQLELANEVSASRLLRLRSLDQPSTTAHWHAGGDSEAARGLRSY